jgi:hypothetical protein
MIGTRHRIARGSLSQSRGVAKPSRLGGRRPAIRHWHGQSRS